MKPMVAVFRAEAGSPGGQRGPCLLGLVASVLLTAAPAWAGGVVGNGTPASCTEAALNAKLVDGGTVTFNCGPSPVTISVTQQKVIGAATVIDGGSADRTILDAGGTTRFFLTGTSVPLTIRNLTLQNGRCLYPTDGTLVAGYGGAIRVGLYAALTVSDSRFLNNTCPATGHGVGGGAFFAQYATVLVERSVFSGNRGSNGAAISVHHTPVTINDSTFTDNATLAYAGGYSAAGGALYVDEAGGGQVVIRRSTFSDNSAAYVAGAVHIYLNPSLDQGAVIEDSTFQSNSTSVNGGAVFYQNRPLTVRGCTFAGNSTANNGGALYVVDSAPLIVSNSTFSGNAATGVAIGDQKGVGGAMLLYRNLSAMTGTLSHLTIVENHANWVGGGIATSGAVSVSLRGSIVAHNTSASTSGIAANCNKPLQDGAFNIQYPAPVLPSNPYDPKCTASVLIADPLLAPLADNGGPTQTRALLAGSPARNAVTNLCPPPTVDQRGALRPQLGDCDIGAYEAAPGLSLDDVTVIEGTGGTTNMVFTVTLSPASSQTVTVGYSTANGTAVEGSDYTSTSGTLTFPAGATSRTISVPVIGDASDENAETFRVDLASPVNAFIADGQGVGTITDDDPPPAVSISDCTVQEGDAGAPPCVFTVSPSTPSGKTVTVSWATANATATAGSDYTAASGTLTFSPGVPSLPLSVLAKGDTTDEADETFLVNLSGPANATLGDAQGQGTIDDDDGPGILIGDASVTEGNAGTKSASFTVSLTAPSPQAITVSYATSDGTASAGSDYIAASGVLTIAAGTPSQPQSVIVNGDVVDEPDESFYLNLLDATDATILDSAGQGTILDDDGGDLWLGELSHGFRSRENLAGGADLFVVNQPPRSSGEIVVDEASGDVGPGTTDGGPWLERPANDLATVLQTSLRVGVGPVRSLRWQNAGSTWRDSYVRVRSRQCTAECGADDVYRIRAYDTTCTIPRFNNSASQVTVLVLQNPTAETISGTVFFWDPRGALRASHAFTLGAHASSSLNTATVPDLAGLSGAVTIVHDGRYGELTGKAVALEPATGFAFDSPMLPRLR